MSAYGGEGPDTAPQPKKKKGSKGLPKGIIEHRTKGKLQARLSYKEDGKVVSKHPGGDREWRYEASCSFVYLL